MEFDLAIVGGAVVDGTGAARYRADLGISDGRIGAIRRGTGPELGGAKTVDATGKVVAPGFIDSNSHADWALAQSDRGELLAPLLLQGITTVVGGGCGYSPAPVPHGGAASLDRLSGFLHATPFAYRWSSVAEMLAALEADRPLVNAAFLVGHNTMRNAVLRLRRRRPSDRELQTMQEMTRRAFRDGAIGLAANLGFRPGAYAADDELLALAGVVAQEGATCAVHARAYTWMSNAYPPFGAPHNLRAVRDLIEIARRSRARLQVSHVLFAGRRTWRTARRVLAELDRASAGGADVGFDAVPFTVGNGPIELLFPPWFIARFPQSAHRAPARTRLIVETAIQRALLGLQPSDVRLLSAGDPSLADLEGLDFATIGRQLGMSALDAQLHVARVAGLGGAAVLVGTFSGDEHHEQPLADVLRHPSCAFITNAAIHGHGVGNPAVTGAFPHVLGHFSRDLGLFSLEEAVRRMTSYPADRMRLKDIGRIAERYAADLVVLDPATVDAPPASGDGAPPGIDTVIVSGEIAATGGRVVPGPGHGRILRRR